MHYEAKFLSIGLVTVQNFNEIRRKKGHKKTIDKFPNRLLGIGSSGETTPVSSMVIPYRPEKTVVQIEVVFLHRTKGF